MNNNFSVTNWQEAFLVAASNILTNIFTYFPTILAALVVFIVGIILAKWARRVTVKVLEKITDARIVRKMQKKTYLALC